MTPNSPQAVPIIKTASEKLVSVLIVDDEPGFCNLLKWELTSYGMQVEMAENGLEGIAMARKKVFDVIISDITMPKMDGLKLLEEVKRIAPHTAVILATGFSAVETAVFAMKTGASDFILKPYDLPHLITCVNRVIERRSHCRSCGKANYE